MSTLSFDGDVIVVTGAGGGMGRTHALELARRKIGAEFLIVTDLVIYNLALSPELETAIEMKMVQVTVSKTLEARSPENDGQTVTSLLCRERTACL